MVTRFATWLALLLLPVSAAALTVEAPPDALRYGEPFTVVLRSERTQPDLRSIDLAPWREHVAVQQSAIAAADGGQTLRLLLNPRYSGDVTLPPLWFAGERSDPLPLQIGTAEDGGQPLAVSVSISQTEVWQRQQVLVRVQVRSHERYYHLQADPFRHPGLHVVPLPSETIQDARSGRTVRRAGWALYPTSAGTLEVELPPIQYRRGGRNQARFALPRLIIEARALPPYVPADLPVGSISLQSQRRTPGLLDTGSLSFWVVEVRGRDLPAAWLPSPLGPVRDNRALQFLAPEAEYQQQANDHGLVSTAHYRIPFSARRSGPLQLPELSLQYFDPESGRLVRVTAAPERAWVLGQSWRAALLALAVLLAALLGAGWLRRVRAYRAWRRNRQEMLWAVARAADARELRRALGQWGRRQGWRLDGSLSTWWKFFDLHYRRVDPELPTLLSGLNRAEFSPHQGAEFEPLRAALLPALRKARRRRRPRRAQPAWLNNRSAMPPAAPR